MDIIKYYFKPFIYFSIKDILLGLVIGTTKELRYGLLGRKWYIELHLIFIHIYIELIRAGHQKKKKVVNNESI